MKIQLDKLFHIFSLCSPSTHEWMQPFQEIKNLYFKLISQVKVPKNKTKKALTLPSFSNQRSLMTLESDGDRDEIQRGLLYKLYLFIYNTFKSLVIFLGYSSTKEAMRAYDWSRIEKVGETLSNEIEEIILKLEANKSKEIVEHKSKLNLKTKDNIFIVSSYSNERIQRFKLMKDFLQTLISCPTNQPFNMPTTSLPMQPLQLKPLQSLSTFPSSSDLNNSTGGTMSNFPFDSDCLKLFIMFCQVQVFGFGYI